MCKLIAVAKVTSQVTSTLTAGTSPIPTRWLLEQVLPKVNLGKPCSSLDTLARLSQAECATWSACELLALPASSFHVLPTTRWAWGVGGVDPQTADMPCSVPLSVPLKLP